MTVCVVILSFIVQIFPERSSEFDTYLSGFSRNSDVRPDSALFYARKMLDAARRSDDMYNIVRAEYALGYTYRYINDYVAAIEHYRKSWQIARSHGFEEREMMATNGLGMSMYRAGNYPEALRYLYRSLLIREKRSEPDELSTIYNNIGLVYLKLWNWPKAHEYLSLALQQKESLDSRDAATLVNLAVCLPYMGRIEDAHLRFAQFREVCKDGCSDQLWSDYYNALGGLHLNQHDLESARFYFQKALDLSKLSRLSGHQEMTYDNLSTLQMELGDYQGALMYSDSALELSLELNIPQRIQNNYRQSAELNTRLGNESMALEMWAKYDSMRTLVMGEEVFNEIYTQELEWIKNSYNDELSAQKELVATSRRSNIIFISMSIIVGLLALLWWYNFRRKKQTLQKLQQTQQQLIRQEKLAALGSLMAGIAHELNNPLSAALVSVRTGRSHANKLKHASSVQTGFSLEKSDVHKDLITGLERRRLRSDLLEKLPGWTDRETIAEYLMDLGLPEVDWAHYQGDQAKLMELLEVMLLEKDLNRIEYSLENMHNVVASLQDSSRGGSNSYVITEVDVQSSLNGALILLHNQLKYGIEVERAFPDETVTAKANPQRLSQVWINLLINAIQSLPGDTGTICIGIDNRFSNFIHVRISDNGSGIGPSDQSHVFQRFFTTRHFRGGNGIGLTIVNDILDELNGKISFVSSANGTTMNVFLPRR